MTADEIVAFWIRWCRRPHSTVEHQDDIDQGCQIIRQDPAYWADQEMYRLADLVRQERDSLS